MKGAKQNAAGRPKRAYNKRPPLEEEEEEEELHQRQRQQAARHHQSVHITPVVDDQQVGHLPLPQPIPGDVSELQDRVNDLGDAWETESIFEDIIDDLTHDTFSNEGK